VTGTVFLSLTILPAKAVVIHQLALRDCLFYVRRISRGHRLLRRVAARLQVGQAPRGAIRLDPRCGSDGASLARRAYSRRGAYLQIRGKRQEKHQVLPLSRHSEDGPAGAGERRHLHGPPGGFLLHLRPLKSGRAYLQRCKTLDALGGEMARGQPTSARLQACGGLDGAIAPEHPLTPRAPYPARRAA
jgi:hypothetical protein